MNSLNNLEQKISNKLRSAPRIKKAVKRIYQKGMYYSHPKKLSEGALIRITPPNEECFFGYYDKCPWDSSERYVLGIRVKDAARNVAPAIPCDILLIDTQENNFCKTIARSHTWNVQQGCMLQWLGPNFDREIIYNDLIEGKYQAVSMDILTQEKTLYEYPIYSVAASGTYALGLDFSRLHRMRPGYGYSNLPDKTEHQLCPDQPCITKINLSTGEIIPLLKYTDLTKIQPRKDMEGAEHKVNHIMINPSETRFMVLHRWRKNNQKYTRLLTFDMDGKNPYILCDDGMVSHCCWKNDREILSWAHKKDIGNAYYIMTDQTEIYTAKWKNHLCTDGHPSYSPTGEKIVTDCYPDRLRMASVFLIDAPNNTIQTAARVFSPFRYDNDTRCDLHPRWNHSGTKICIDSAHEGYRGMYILPANNRKIKILYIVSTLKDGGPTNQLLGIIKNLDFTIFEPYILTLSSEPKNSKSKLFEKIDIPIVTLGLSRKQFMLFGKAMLKNKIIELNPDIIHTSGIRPDTSVARLKIQLPHCASIRNYVYEDYIPKFGRLMGTLMAWSHKKAMQKINYLIFCSNTLKNMYGSILNKELYAIQDGIETTKYNICTLDERKILREKHHLESEKKILLVVGSLIHRKDPLTVLRAFIQAEHQDECLLLFLGNGVLWDECIKLQQKNIRFLGHVENVAEYLQLADGFLSSSLSEGLPNSVLEAGASGLPMLLSDIPQHREIFEETLSGIHFFEKKNVTQLKNSLDHWIPELGHIQRSEIRKHVIESFDMHNTSQNFQSMYKAMMASGDSI